jgi:uncharacterized protein YwgA
MKSSELEFEANFIAPELKALYEQADQLLIGCKLIEQSEGEYKGISLTDAISRLQNVNEDIDVTKDKIAQLTKELKDLKEVLKPQQALKKALEKEVPANALKGMKSLAGSSEFLKEIDNSSADLSKLPALKSIVDSLLKLN